MKKMFYRANNIEAFNTLIEGFDPFQGEGGEKARKALIESPALVHNVGADRAYQFLAFLRLDSRL